MIKSGFPSIALSASFVILGASADETKVAPIVKKMNIVPKKNIFFVITLHLEEEYHVKNLTGESPEIKAR
jgi:hypothetical protein